MGLTNSSVRCFGFVTERTVSSTHGVTRRPRGRCTHPPLPWGARRRSDRGLPDSAARRGSLRPRQSGEAVAGPQGRPERESSQRLHSPPHRLQEEQNQGRGTAAEVWRLHRGYHRGEIYYLMLKLAVVKAVLPHRPCWTKSSIS